MSDFPHVIEGAPSFPVTIHIAGDYAEAKEVCQRYCDKVGLCVTVRHAAYVYTGGREDGVQVGLINYPRFPKDPHEIRMQAIRLAYLLRAELGQESCTIETPEQTIWLSWRQEDRKENTA